MGGGVGEAMLIGAAMGGGSAAMTGGDPLKRSALWCSRRRLWVPV
jgi:hypothetical protein